MPAPKYSRYYTYIKPVSENKFVRSSAPYIFSIITTSILIIFAIRPTISTISNLQKNIENNQQVLDNITSKSLNLSEAKKRFESIPSSSKNKINTAIPQDAEITTLIASLQNAVPKEATISAIHIEGVTVVDTQPLKIPPSLNEIKFIFNVQGSYTQIMATLSQLKKTSRTISIDTIDIGKQSEGAILLSISGKGYFLR